MPDDWAIIVKPHTSMHSIFQEATDPLFMSINDRMKAQDPNVTFSTPKLSHAIERVLKSETQVVKISEIDGTMLKTRISHTTSSGGIYSHSYKKTTFLISYEIAGESDLHFSSEGVYPSYLGYALRERSPFIDNINKW